MSLILMTALFYMVVIFWCQLYEVANDWLYRLHLRERAVVPADWLAIVVWTAVCSEVNVTVLCYCMTSELHLFNPQELCFSKCC